jgi:hypothetical protein
MGMNVIVMRATSCWTAELSRMIPSHLSTEKKCEHGSFRSSLMVSYPRGMSGAHASPNPLFFVALVTYSIALLWDRIRVLGYWIVLVIAYRGQQ